MLYVTVDYKEAGTYIMSFVVKAHTLVSAKNRAQTVARAYGVENMGNTPTYTVSKVDETADA